ncbi:MAG: hypothetical protein ACXW1Z_25165, partial [Methylobacter sp.]
ERCVWPLSAWPQFAINFIADIKMLEELSSGSTFYCISPGNKKPAKPYDLRVFRVLCTALNQCLVRGPVSNMFLCCCSKIVINLSFYKGNS